MTFAFGMKGPKRSWEQLEKMSPAICTLRDVKNHIDYELAGVSKGKKHTIPEKDFDVRVLTDAYLRAQLYRYKKGRAQPSKNDHPKDYVAMGIERLNTGGETGTSHRPGLLGKWWARRGKERSSKEIWGKDVAIEYGTDNSDDDGDDDDGDEQQR